MNYNQKEICDLLVRIFTVLPVREITEKEIQEGFNMLDATEKEWCNIEDCVLEILSEIKVINP